MKRSHSATIMDKDDDADADADADDGGQTSTEDAHPPPLSLMEKYSHVVEALEGVEQTLRLKYHPTLIERAAPLEVDDLRDENPAPTHDPKHDEATTTTSTTILASESKSTTATMSEDGTAASLRKRGLKEVLEVCPAILPRSSLSLSPPKSVGWDTLLTLDVSHNELTELPGLSALKNLRVLDLNRNWFNTLPAEISGLVRLETLVASRNFLKPNQQSLRWDALKESCRHLSVLDLRYNQKCCRPFHRDRVREALLPLRPTIAMTLWEEEAHGNHMKDTNANHQQSNNSHNYVGSSAAQRDPVLLRSQLEPLGTVALRKRLVCDFGKPPTDPATVDRAGVMRDLLKAYFDEGLAYFPNPNNSSSNAHPSTTANFDDKENPTTLDYDSLVADRKSLQIYGSPVPAENLQRLMVELNKWTSHTGLVNKNRERPSIHASNYMILRKPEEPSPSDASTNGNNRSKPNKLSRRALRKAQKRERYKALWKAGIDALNTVDPVFAERHCTEIAITHGFSGSPHRDKQNCGPFYGLSLGNYDDADGKGGIVVEASARVVVRVNTKHRLGRVDGRYVHWVAPWDHKAAAPPPGEEPTQDGPAQKQQQQQQQRYSLIYYETGHEFVPPGPAVFSIPPEASRKNE